MVSGDDTEKCGKGDNSGTGVKKKGSHFFLKKMNHKCTKSEETCHGRMEGDMMAEACAEVEAGATESGASEPSQAALEADQYEEETDVMDDDDSKILSKGDYVDNSPGKRHHLERAKGVWVWIRRLKKHQTLTTTNPTQRRTHVCTCPGCCRLINMGYDSKQNCWQTGKGLKHDKQYHAHESKALNVVEQRTTVKAGEMINVMMSSCAGPHQMVVSARDSALAASARSYIYGRGRISKETFDDPAHRDRDQAMFRAGVGKGQAPLLHRKKLVEWVRAEYSVFLILLQFMITRCLEYSKGNAFAQGINDCCTLKNHVKHCAMGIVFVDPELRENHTVCVAMQKTDGWKDLQIADLVRGVFQCVLQRDYSQICHSTIVGDCAGGL